MHTDCFIFFFKVIIINLIILYFFLSFFFLTVYFYQWQCGLFLNFSSAWHSWDSACFQGDWCLIQPASSAWVYNSSFHWLRFHPQSTGTVLLVLICPQVLPITVLVWLQLVQVHHQVACIIKLIYKLSSVMFMVLMTGNDSLNDSLSQ